MNANKEHGDFMYKPTQSQKEMIDACNVIRDGNNTYLQELMEMRGFRQWTNDEIKCVNMIRSEGFVDNATVEYHRGAYTKLPHHTFEHDLIVPALVLSTIHLHKSYYLAHLMDMTNVSRMWVVSKPIGDVKQYKALFDASPWLERSE